jgi:glycosyltransferase involved in cell wall biosynthesis
VPRADLVQLARGALAVVQPSQFEGWSTIVELARSLGRPVLLSDLAVHREQLPAGPFFARHSAEALAEALAGLWQRLRPGPDLAAEAVGRRDAEERCRSFARAFVDLASPA